MQKGVPKVVLFGQKTELGEHQGQWIYTFIDFWGLRKILFFDYSIYLLKELIKFDKNNYIYFFHLGKAYQDQEKFEYAIKFLILSLKINPNLEIQLIPLLYVWLKLENMI